MRERWTIDSETACRKLAAKSRSDDESMLLVTTRLKPSLSARNFVSIGVTGAGNGAGSERQRVRLFTRRFQPRVIAPQRGRMTQQKVGHEHGHRPPQVRVRRHQRVAGLLRLIGERRDCGAQFLLQQRNAAAQIQAQVDRDLFVARSSGVQPAAGIADPRHQLPFDERVDVLVVAVDPRRILAACLENRREAVGDRLAVRGIEHAGARQRFGPREASGHVIFEQAPIERERHAEIKRGRIRRGIKSSRPQRLRHAESFSSDNLRPALEEPHADRARHLLRRRIDVRVEAGAQRIEPFAAIDGFHIGRRDGRIETLLRFRRDVAPELGVREMQHDGGRRLVERARAGAVGLDLDAVETADAVLAGDRLQALDQLAESHRHAVDADGRAALEFDRDMRGLGGRLVEALA